MELSEVISSGEVQSTSTIFATLPLATHNPPPATRHPWKRPAGFAQVTEECHYNYIQPHIENLALFKTALGLTGSPVLIIFASLQSIT